MIRRLSCLGAAALLAGCGSTLKNIADSDEQNAGVCPQAFVLEDAERFIEFDGEEELANVAWSGEITNVRSTCRYVDDRPIAATLTIDFAVGRGPAAQGTEHQVNYFVAVTRRDRAVIAKETFILPVRVRGDVATVDLTEELRNIEIPRKDESISGTNFEIAVGFALTSEQVIYNRSGKSLKFPEL